MPESRFSFFTRYYFKKHISRNLTENDIFRKKLFRLQKKLPGAVVKYSETEFLYQIKNVNGKALELIMRGRQSSDVQVMDQVFAGKEYAPLVEEINKRGQQKNIRFIIDAGTNVGYTTTYLKTFFPGAAVTAIEPDHQNSIQAEKNFALNNLENILMMEGGVWSKDAWLELKNDLYDGKEWSYYVTESKEPTGLRGFSFETILSRTSHLTIDILKIDIEGSEKELFNHGKIMNDVLEKTKFLAIEIHDETNIRHLIYETLRENGFEWFDRGELTIATNIRQMK